ncbi:MAG TPA: putative metal-binding motif-containing protein, partial [Chitinophagales bacterium]|nr:putative metal-binding motif-containing protein [Chitinophagales bacterium]
YSASSNNNLFYAGTPSATNVIYYDGTTAQSTMTAYKALVSTRDAASVTENPTWQSTSGASANFLKYSVAVATQIESGGAAIVGFTDDFTGTTRNASTPDIGAWELAGITADLVGPTIAYTAIPNSAVAGTQSFSSVTITDLSGVNGTSGTRPRVYYKLTTNANTFNDNTNATDGWKYVEANGSTSPFDFTIDYSKLFGGAGIAIGNTVQYFVVAQDNAGTPNIGINNGVFAATPTSVALTSAAFPLTGTINQFNIVSSISGTFTVCTSGCDYTSLTNAGGAFADINAKLVSGNIILNINGDLTAETAANGLNEFASPYTITIQPNGGATRTISGSVSSAALIKLNGADRVTINGLNTGGNALNITNTATTAPTVISLVSLGTGAGATSNTVTNTTLSTGVATTIGYGISIGGSTPGSAGADNDNNTISNNTITAAPVGIYANGTASVTSGGNDNLSISGNSISYNSTLSGVIGIQLANSLNATVSQNTLNITTSASTAPVGISLETGFVSSSVSRNTITQILATNTGGYGGRGITVGTGTATSALTISNNMIYGVNGSNWSSFGNSSSMGIAIGTIGGSSTLTTTTGGVNLYYNSVNMTGSMGSGSTTALTASLYVGSGASSIDIRNNVFVNTQVGTSTTQKNYAIYSAAANTAFSNINYNDYFVSNTFNTASAILGFLTSDRTDLAGIIAGFGGNANSINKDPQFVSSTNLHVNTAVTSYLESAATTIAGITTDYDGDTRNATTPDIGLDEGAFTAPVTNDLQATAFISPVALGSVVTGVSFTPQASFTNNGTATQTSVTVRYRIVDATLTEVYNNTQVIASIASGVTTNISFASTSLAAAGTYTIYAKAELVGDAVTGNDQISSTLTAEAPLCGTYAIGASQPVGYQNLTQAAAKINGLGVSCAVTFALQSDYTSASETYPIVFNQYTGASAINTLTIKPATGVTATISGSLASNALIRLNGADYIIIDGSNNGSTSRDLTINNTNTTAPSGIALVSLGTGLGATNNTIKNLTITTGVSTTLGYGIAAGGATPGTAGDDNDNTIIQNNAITSPGTGIYVGAGATGLNNNLDINNNNITYSGSLSSVIGIQVLQATGASVSQNTINITTSATTAPVGISIETGVVNSTISRNTLGTIISTNTGGYAGRGITIGTGNASSNITVSNNMIYGVNGSNWSSFGNSSAMGIAIGVIGGSSTLTTTAGGINLYYNSISMNGSMGSGSTSALTTALYIGSGASALDIRNNILANTQVGTSTTQKNYAIYSAATSAAFTNINYNDYYVTNTFNAGSAILGNIGATDRTTIGAIQTGFGGNTNSIITNPNFVNAASNLHINTAALSPVDNTGTPVAVTTDFDGDSRSATTPDMGLDEMTSCLNITVYADADGDTYGNPAVTAIDCDGGAPPAGYVLNNSDCDDTNAAINPTTTWYLDADADLYYTGAGVTSCTSPGVGYAYTGLTAGGDCNDANSAINPGATEICNGIDDDCDGSTDEGVTLTFYADTDGDTYGDPASTTTACSAPIGYVANNTDCNDANAAINPGATEVCNLVDDDCDGLTDEGVTTVFYADADGDGFGDAASTTNACTAPSGYVADNTDCNDALITYADLDGDTYGAGAMVACGVANNTDCDDSDAAVNPGATEICNGIDDDCDGNIDEAGAVGESTWYADADGDTYGDAASSITACTAPVGYVGANDDCDDTNAAINPGATEICNGVDDECDGSTDEGLTYYTYYADAEGDGFGDPF